MRRAVLGDAGAADLHLHDGVAAIEIAAHLGAQRVEVLAGIVVAAGRIDEDARIGASRPSRSASRRNSGLPAIFATASQIAMSMVPTATERSPWPPGFSFCIIAAQHVVRIEVVAGRRRAATAGSASSRRGAKALADQPALAVAAVGVEAVADDALAVALDVGDDGDEARRHLGEVDIGVADRRSDRLGDFGDIENANGHGLRCDCDAAAASKRSAAADGDFLAGDRCRVLG